MHALTENYLESHASFFNTKSEEQAVLDKAGVQYEITNSSKSRDILLRVATMFQATEMSLIFVDEHSNFIRSEGMPQLSLSVAANTSKKRVACNFFLSSVLTTTGNFRW